MSNAIDQIQDETTRRFAEASYDDYYNNIEELPSEVDQVDMKTWGLTEAQWHEAVNAARLDIAADREEKAE